MELEAYCTTPGIVDIDIDMDAVVDKVLEEFPITEENPDDGDLIRTIDGFANDIDWYTKYHVSSYIESDFKINEEAVVEGFGRALYKRYNKDVDEDFSFVKVIYLHRRLIS